MAHKFSWQTKKGEADSINLKFESQFFFFNFVTLLERSTNGGNSLINLVAVVYAF